MKNNFTRLLSLLLVFVLVLGIFPTAMAAENDGAAETEPSSTDAASDILPEAIAGYDPNDPDNPYPYGLPVTEYIPEDVQEFLNSGIMLMAADQGTIPDEMWDNAILRALEYTGYDVQRQKDKGQLYQYLYIGSRLPNNDSSVLSDIGYWSSGACPNGDETVADSSTVSGKAPKISYFESNGLVCASFVTYFLCNYLPNIEGVDTSVVYEKAKELGTDGNAYYLTTVSLWKRTLDALSKEAGSGVTKYTSASTAYDNLVPGDVVVFAKDDGTLTHVAIYAGEYNLYNGSTNLGVYHYMIHVGNSRGPEISIIEWMSTSTGSKASDAVAWYHLDFNDIVDATGFIEVNKSTPDGEALTGAYFVATNQFTQDKYVIGPTDSKGYAKSEELPLGTYVVEETVFPTGYTSSGETSWTVTLTEDTPNMTITINAVNQLITGKAKIVKAATNGGSVAGWHFEVKNSSGTVIGTYVTDSTGEIVLDLEPGTYTVTETDGEYEYWHNDPTPVRTVTIKAGETAKVTFQNQWVGKAKIVKTATNGGTVEGWEFTITDADGNTVGTYTTDATGTILVDLEPGTYTVQETDRNDPYWYCDTEPQTVTVQAGKTATVTFRNEWIGKAKIIKTLANPEAVTVEGWTFTIHKVVTAGTAISAEYLTMVTTGADGTILQDLEPGEYLITEVLEDDSLWECITEKSQTVIVEAGSTTEVSFTNALRPGEIRIEKVDTQGEPLDGVEFLLEWSEDGINWSPVTFTDSAVPQIGGCTTEGLTDGKLVTGKDGNIEFSGLYPLLQYRLTETATKDGYQLLAGYPYEGGLSVENDLTVSITVVNAEIFTLPKTGSKSLVLMPLSILLCLGICAGAIVYLRKKED